MNLFASGLVSQCLSDTPQNSKFHIRSLHFKNPCFRKSKIVARPSCCQTVVTGKTAGTGLSYKEAGVDIDAGAELVKRIAKMAPGIGGFGGLFPLGKDLSSIVEGF